MKYYQVCWADRCDGGYAGIIPGFFTSKEEAQKCADWYEKHPDPDEHTVCHVTELDLDNIIEKFVPPMSEEAYEEMCKKAFYDEPEAGYWED